MRRFIFLLLFVVAVFTDCTSKDPVVLKIGNTKYAAHDFQDFLDRNMKSYMVADSMIIARYAKQFEELKLKVEEAKSKGIHKDTAFINEFNHYRSLQTDDYLFDMEAYLDTARLILQEAKEAAGPDGSSMLGVIEIVPESKEQTDYEAAWKLVNDIYKRLQKGEGFSELALKYSSHESAQRGGMIGWKERNSFSDTALANDFFALEAGQFTEPLALQQGTFIIMACLGRQRFDNFENEKESILAYMDANGYRERAVERFGQNLIETYRWRNLTPDQAIEKERTMLEKHNPAFRALSSEYYDGLLMYRIASQEVWKPAAKDTAGLAEYFESHKADYAFSEPTFLGYLVECHDQLQYDSVKTEYIDKIITREDAEALFLTTHIKDLGFRFYSGPYVKGQSPVIDYYAFGSKVVPDGIKKFPYVKILGSVKEQPEKYSDVQPGINVAYRNYMTEKWVESLKAKYPVKWNLKVLQTFVK